MSASYAPLPSHETMQFHCHRSPNTSLVLQAGSLLIVLAGASFTLFSIPVVLAGVLSFVTGKGFWNGNVEALQEWLISTVFFAFVTASALTALAIYVKTYLRTQFGAPAHSSELHADLAEEEVIQMCHDYMLAQSLDQAVVFDSSRSRLIGLMQESTMSSTFLEITTLAMEENRTWIVVRGASIVLGNAALLSSFYNDGGASRKAVNNMIDVFSPYASRKRRSYPGSSSKQALPAMQPINVCPPPTLTRVSR